MTQLALPLCSTDGRRKPASGNERVLRALMEHQGEWVELSYARLGCMVHSRISDILGSIMTVATSPETSDGRRCGSRSETPDLTT